MLKRIVCLLVTVCVLSLCLSCVAFADTDWNAKFKVEQTSAEDGDGIIKVRVSISDISSKSGIICAIYNLHYDNDCLELVSWENGLPSSWDFSGDSTLCAEDWSGILEDDGEKYFLYTLMNVEADDGVKDDNVLYTEFRFKVLDDSAASTEIKFTEISYVDADDLVNGTSLDLEDKTAKLELNTSGGDVSGDTSSAESSSEESVPETTLPEESVVSNPEIEAVDPNKVVVDITLKDITDPAGVSSLLFHVKYDGALLKFVEYSWIKPDNWIDNTNITEDMMASQPQNNGDLLFWVLNVDPDCGVKEDGALGFRVTFELLGEEFKPEMLTIDQVEICNSELQEMKEGSYSFSIVTVSGGGASATEDGATVKIIIAIVAAVLVLGGAGFAWYWFGKKKNK